MVIIMVKYNGQEFILNNCGYYVSRRGLDIIGLLHRYKYEIEHNCVIPKGMVIHHKNFDKLDNDIDNLQIMTRAKHNKIHHEGTKHSEEAKRKIGDSHRGKPRSQEVRFKISEGVSRYNENKRKNKTA